MPRVVASQRAVITLLAGLDRFDSGWESMRSDAAAGDFAFEVGSTAVSSADLERLLWTVVGAALVGDVVTTFVGLHLGLAESNPVARAAIDGYGVIGMLALKAFAVGLAYACRTLLVREYRPIIPAGLALPWAVATVSNVYMISTVL